MDNFQLKEFQKKYSGTCARVLNLLTNKVIRGDSAPQLLGILENCTAITLLVNKFNTLAQVPEYFF